MENSDISISCLSKLSVIEMENSDISIIFFQNCSLKETTNPEYIEKFISFTLRVTVEYGLSRMDFVS